MEGLCILQAYFFSHMQSSQCWIMLYSLFSMNCVCVKMFDAGVGAHPIREFYVSVSDAGGGFRHDQQVQRGVPWRKILRWE
jgi:hypothetical protein